MERHGRADLQMPSVIWFLPSCKHLSLHQSFRIIPPLSLFLSLSLYLFLSLLSLSLSLSLTTPVHLHWLWNTTRVYYIYYPVDLFNAAASELFTIEFQVDIFVN